MRIAALSDIHSNIFALNAVLADIEQRSADVIVNLGDILYGPIAPQATYSRLMEHDIITISGNQDRQIYQSSEAEVEANPTLQFILQQLEPAAITWLKALPFDMQLSDAVYLCHGSPSDDLVYLLENVSSGHPQLRADSDILAHLNGQTSELILCGHTHIPRAVTTSTGQLIVNPGSVGLPAYQDDLPCPHHMQTYSPHASYALIEQTQQGWVVEQIKVPYDHQAAAEQAMKLNRQDWEHCLTTGRTEA